MSTSVAEQAIAAKDPVLIVRTAEPFNAGPPPEELTREAVTPTPLFFVRNHGTVPAIDPAAYRLRVGGLVERPLELSLDDLRGAFPRQTAAATLQCAGNRRMEMLAVREIPGEVPWDLEAISHAEWGGVELRRVLERAGVAVPAPDAAAHVAFVGLDEVERRGRRFGFGGSIPLAKALGPEVLLAYEMNSAPLTPLHGAPLRLVVPGYIGARSVKWLGEIAIQDAPSDNYFQAVAYRLFPPEAEAATARDEDGRMLGELFTSAAICAPLAGDELPAGQALLRGYAVGHDGRPVERVEVSADGGQTWTAARLLGEGAAWAWRLWEATVELAPGPATLAARVADPLHPQPADVRQTWNFKGYMNNAWHRVAVNVH
jgi:sulfite oxidase